MYTDESGDTGLPSDGSPARYFCLSGVVVHELRWKEVLESLMNFRRWIKYRHGIYFRRLDPALCKIASYSDHLGIVRL